MAEYETNKESRDEWYTPPEIFDALGLEFDLDPFSPSYDHWTPAKKFYTKADDGMAQPWEGLVFVNPPFGGRNSHIPALIKFIEYGNGIMLLRAYTSAGWFHDYATQAESMLFPRGKTKFIRPDGSIGKSPGHGIVLLGMGDRSNWALEQSGLGLFVSLRSK